MGTYHHWDEQKIRMSIRLTNYGRRSTLSVHHGHEGKILMTVLASTHWTDQPQSTPVGGEEAIYTAKFNTSLLLE